jgi:midasin
MDAEMTAKEEEDDERPKHGEDEVTPHESNKNDQEESDNVEEEMDLEESSEGVSAAIPDALQQTTEESEAEGLPDEMEIDEGGDVEEDLGSEDDWNDSSSSEIEGGESSVEEDNQDEADEGDEVMDMDADGNDIVPEPGGQRDESRAAAPSVQNADTGTQNGTDDSANEQDTCQSNEKDSSSRGEAVGSVQKDEVSSADKEGHQEFEDTERSKTDDSVTKNLEVSRSLAEGENREGDSYEFSRSTDVRQDDEMVWQDDADMADGDKERASVEYEKKETKSRTKIDQKDASAELTARTEKKNPRKDEAKDQDSNDKSQNADKPQNTDVDSIQQQLSFSSISIQKGTEHVDDLNDTTNLFDGAAMDVDDSNDRIELDSYLKKWNDVSVTTEHSSRDLCEQLRRILEPNLPSKLKGDYKTGKRINLKKIIPFIASGFKKDKIWMRRTLAIKRNYQVPSEFCSANVAGFIMHRQFSKHDASCSQRVCDGERRAVVERVFVA